MELKSLFVKFTWLLYLVLMLHLLALQYYLYWVYWWYDIPMHFLGGAWVGGMAVLSWTRFRNKKFLQGKALHARPCLAVSGLFFVGVGAVLMVGGLWELFEFSLDTFIILQKNDILDTISDMGMNVAGALSAVLFITRYLDLNLNSNLNK